MFRGEDRPQSPNEPTLPRADSPEDDDPFDSLDRLFDDSLAEPPAEEASPAPQPHDLPAAGGDVDRTDLLRAQAEALEWEPGPSEPVLREVPAAEAPQPPPVAPAPPVEPLEEPSAQAPEPMSVAPPPLLEPFEQPSTAAPPTPPEEAMVRSFTGPPLEEDARHEEVLYRLRSLEREIRGRAERTEVALQELSERIGSDLGSLEQRAANLEMAVSRLRSILEVFNTNVRQLAEGGGISTPSSQAPETTPPVDQQREVQGMIDRIWNEPPAPSGG